MVKSKYTQPRILTVIPFLGCAISFYLVRYSLSLPKGPKGLS